MLMTLSAIALACVTGYTLFYDELNDDNRVCTDKELQALKGDGVQVSQNIRLSPKYSNEHILMIAPSGCGKSRSFIMPNVINLHHCSIVVTDPSGEIEKTCATDKKKYIFSPFSNNTIGYDPLKNCKTEFEVRKIASVILENGMVESQNSRQKEWLEMAKPLFTSYLLFNWYSKQYSFDNMIYNICTKPILPITDSNNKINKQMPTSIVEEVMCSKCFPAIAELQMFLQVMSARETVSSIRIILNSCLQLFLDSNLETLFTRPAIDLRRIRQEDSIIYIQIPERHSEYYRPLTATFVTQLIDVLLDNSQGLQTYLMFDEFCNIGKIPNICTLLSTARKHNVSIIAAIQNLTQLTRNYGEIDGKELQELFKTIVVCSGLKDSAEYISKLVGKKKVVKNKNTTMEDLLPPDKIRCMDKTDVLIICNNKRPVIDKMLPIVA